MAGEGCHACLDCQCRQGNGIIQQHSAAYIGNTRLEVEEEEEEEEAHSCEVGLAYSHHCSMQGRQ